MYNTYILPNSNTLGPINFTIEDRLIMLLISIVGGDIKPCSLHSRSSAFRRNMEHAILGHNLISYEDAGHFPFLCFNLFSDRFNLHPE